MASYQGLATSILKLHKYVIYTLLRVTILASIIIMQDDGIHANLRYTQQAYVATVMKVTHVIFVQFPHS